MKTNNSITSHTEKINGFSLVEVLVVIALMGILATLVISSFSNAAQDSREIMSRQQQAVVQSAVSNWVAAEIGTFFDPNTGDAVAGTFQTVGDVLSRYNSAATGLAKLALVQAYLDDATYSHIISNTTDADGNQLKTGAMTKVNPQRYLLMPTWTGGSYPKVELLP